MEMWATSIWIALNKPRPKGGLKKVSTEVKEILVNLISKTINSIGDWTSRYRPKAEINATVTSLYFT